MRVVPKVEARRWRRIACVVIATLVTMSACSTDPSRGAVCVTAVEGALVELEELAMEYRGLTQQDVDLLTGDAVAALEALRTIGADLADTSDAANCESGAIRAGYLTGIEGLITEGKGSSALLETAAITPPM